MNYHHLMLGDEPHIKAVNPFSVDENSTETEINMHESFDKSNPPIPYSGPAFEGVKTDSEIEIVWQVDTIDGWVECLGVNDARTVQELGGTTRQVARLKEQPVPKCTCYTVTEAHYCNIKCDEYVRGKDQPVQQMCEDCKGHGWRISPYAPDDSGICPNCNGTGGEPVQQDEDKSKRYYVMCDRTKDAFLLHLIDVVWGEAHEDESVPSTIWAKQMIVKASETFPGNHFQPSTPIASEQIGKLFDKNHDTINIDTYNCIDTLAMTREKFIEVVTSIIATSISPNIEQEESKLTPETLSLLLDFRKEAIRNKEFMFSTVNDIRQWAKPRLTSHSSSLKELKGLEEISDGDIYEISKILGVKKPSFERYPNYCLIRDDSDYDKNRNGYTFKLWIPDCSFEVVINGRLGQCADALKLYQYLQLKGYKLPKYY